MINLSEKKEASFVKGALILAVSSVIVKVIGAVFRIPLTNLVGDYTMGLYSIAYRYYSILLTIATAGIPIAISKMISESRALGKTGETKKIFRTAIWLCVTIGLIGAVFLLFGSGALANAANDSNAIPGIIALAPAVLFMAITAAFRGYFQGHGNMLPTGVTQIIEALSRLVFGLLLAWILLSNGYSESFVSAGIITGITMGTILTVLVMLMFSAMKKKREGAITLQNDESRSNSDILKSLLGIAIPVTIGSLIMNLTSTIDMFLITNRLADIGYVKEDTTSLYGIYENYALPIFNLIPSIIISLNVSVTPTISAAYAVKDTKKLHETLLSALRIVIIFTLPAAVGISILSEPILSVLFASKEAIGGVPTAAPVLSILSVASFFLCASSLTSTSMQAMGKPTIPLITMAIGAVVKIVANYILIAIPGVELMGAAIGTVLCYVVITVLNMIMLSKIVGFRPKFMQTYIRPLICCAIMGAVVFFSYELCLLFVGNLISVAVSVFLGVVVYLVSMILLRGITKEDVMGLPKGEKIASLIFRNK
ncbi:MAG: polysaccharide biosynthesis protein [Ruminococcaceae bacterium]|nr:polysaccharide biosynthesis protein [Oscillospiraceae bacterium]